MCHGVLDKGGTEVVGHGENLLDFESTLMVQPMVFSLMLPCLIIRSFTSINFLPCLALTISHCSHIVLLTVFLLTQIT